jgi:hypothetical protein
MRANLLAGSVELVHNVRTQHLQLHPLNLGYLRDTMKRTQKLQGVL